MFHRPAAAAGYGTASNGAGPLRRRLRAALCAGLCAAMAGPAAADDLETFLSDFSAVISKVQLARTLTTLCNERDPAGAQVRAAQTAQWEADNEVALFDVLTRGVADKYSELRPQLDSVSAQAREQVGPQLDAEPEACSTLKETFGKDDMQLREKIRALLVSGSALGVRLKPSPSQEAAEIVPLTRLSAMILDLMEDVGPEEGALNDRKLRAAREDYAETWLEAHGPISVFGRVTGESDLREWRGDQQSRYALSCHSFANETDRTGFAAAAGKNVVVTGALRHFVDRGKTGTLTLDRCALSPVRLIGTLLVQSGDEAGLVDRPLDISEAYAGPRAGPSLRSIDRVIYDADFTTRMDGFGNGYVDRNEAIYVLLKDGNAFLHEWSFPVTDVNTALLRKREPGKWFRWTSRGKDVELKPSDGGETIRLDEPSRLVPVGNTTLLDKEYYYLEVAMMGARTDRSYVFRKNGELDYSRSGFVAGAFGSLYFMISGNANNERQERRKYRFEDYALVIETEEGEERQFFAIRDTGNRAAPDEIFVKGQVYWEKGKEN